MPVQTWTPGQVLTAAQLTTLTNMLLYPTALAVNLNPAVAGNFYDCTATLTLTLPASPATGDTIGAKNRGSSSNTITISRAGSQVIYGPGFNGVTSIALNNAESFVTLTFDGTNWQMVDSGGIGAGTTLAAKVASGEATTSASYTDLSTSGPAVTIVTNTTALVALSSQIQQNTANDHGVMSFAVSGATTIAAADNVSIWYPPSTNNLSMRFGGSWYLSGLTAGSNTGTAKYKIITGGTATFTDRTLSMTSLVA